MYHQGDRHHPGTPGSLYQSEVHKRLGLAKQTISKMLKRLVELGLIIKRRDACADRRRNILSFTEEGVRRIRRAFGAAFAEVLPVPEETQDDGSVPRWERKAAALEDKKVDVRLELQPPQKVGREVAKIYTAFAWEQVRGGRRGKRRRHLTLLMSMIDFGSAIARALGDTSEEIYTLAFPQDH